MDNPKVSLEEREAKVREFFKDRKSPYHCITYEQLLKHLPIHDGNYPSQNLNLIDLHLRYHWYVRQKMAAYKWIPIACLTPMLFHNYWLVLVIPAFTALMFDHYFEAFFHWRHSHDRIINLRLEFATKLAKPTHKMRRVQLFQKLAHALNRLNQRKEAETLETPLKYIKFGQFTEYLFHADSGEKEQSSILQTTIFQTFLGLRDFVFGLNQLSMLKDIWRSFKQDFIAFKQDTNRTRFLIDYPALLQRQQIKEVEVYTLEDNIDHNIRRFSQLWGYFRRGSLQPSNFKLWEVTNFSKYEDIFQPIRYNIKDNSSDLLLYYSILAVPKLFTLLFRRR